MTSGHIRAGLQRIKLIVISAINSLSIPQAFDTAYIYNKPNPKEQCHVRWIHHQNHGPNTFEINHSRQDSMPPTFKNYTP